MKLVVFGVTGGTGRQVVEQALAVGHTVTAVARRPEAITLQHKRLTVIRGDVLEAETLPQAIAGQDVVISAVLDNHPSAAPQRWRKTRQVSHRPEPASDANRRLACRCRRLHRQASG